jgi:hypothetical protein
VSSLPVDAMRVPAAVPALDDATLTAKAEADATDAGQYVLSLAVSDAPTAHARAVAPMRLRVWQQIADGPISSAGPDLTVRTGAATMKIRQPRVGGAIPAMKLSLAIVDPLGRVGPVTVVPVDAV